VRDKRVTRQEATEAAERLRDVRAQVREVAPLEAVHTRAMRLLSSHQLRTADSLQLAASLIWCEEQPGSETFVCLDQRLREAARREGFTLLPTDL
jgi:predicted nucleic acid-binding protein